MNQCSSEEEEPTERTSLLSSPATVVSPSFPTNLTQRTPNMEIYIDTERTERANRRSQRSDIHGVYEVNVVNWLSFSFYHYLELSGKF